MSKQEEYNILLDMNGQLLTLLGKRMAMCGQVMRELFQPTNNELEDSEQSSMQDAMPLEDQEIIIDVWDKILRLSISSNIANQKAAIEEVPILQSVMSLYSSFNRIPMPRVIANDYQKFTDEALHNEILHDVSVQMASIKNQLFKDTIENV